MLDANEFNFAIYQDARAKQHTDFVEGESGPLLLATHKKTGERFIVKHTYRHNAANEFVACWLGHHLGVPVPEAHLLTAHKQFASKYAVAISFLPDLQNFEKSAVPAEMQDDLIGQFALNILISNTDVMQLNLSGSHIYSYDFSESFYNSDEFLLKTLLLNEDMGIDLMKRKLSAYSGYLNRMDFDVPGLAKEFHLDSEKQKDGIIAVAGRVLNITDKEIGEMSDELMELYPAGCAVYYEECIHD